MGRLIGASSTAVGVLALAFALWWVGRAEPQAAAEDGRPPYVLPVTLVQVERGRLEPKVRLTGTVRSPARAQLAFTLPGLLTQLNVREADRFDAGQVLAQLDPGDQNLLLKSAMARHRLAQEELAKLRAGTRNEIIGRLRAALDSQGITRDLALADFERAEKLGDSIIVTKADLERLASLHLNSIARFEAASEQLKEAVAGSRPEDIAISQAKVEVARTQVDLAQREVDKTLLVAPSGGVVVRRMAAPGGFLRAGAGVLEIVNLEELEIDVEIPSRYAHLIEDGARVILTIDEHPGLAIETELSARIPAADERSRNFRGLVRMNASDDGVGLLQPGMFVRLELDLRPLTEVLIVPTDALRVIDGGIVLVVAQAAAAGGAAELEAAWQPVRILGEAGGHAAVQALDGELQAGTQIVLTGNDLAYPGAALLPREIPTAAEVFPTEQR